jgi:hypothetical protein
MSFIPLNKWMAGFILLLTIYIMYGTSGSIVETTLPQAATDAGTNQYGMEIISNMTSNFWWGIVIMVGAALLFLIVAGIPGQQEETIL